MLSALRKSAAAGLLGAVVIAPFFTGAQSQAAWAALAVIALAASGVFLAASSSRPRRLPAWPLAAALGGLFCLMLAQLIPIPSGAVSWISPSRAERAGEFADATDRSPGEALTIAASRKAARDSLLLYGAYVCVFLCSASVFGRPRGARLLFMAVAASGAVMAIYGLWGVLEDGLPLKAAYTNRNRLGALLAMQLFAALGWLAMDIDDRSAKGRIAAAACASAIGLALVLTLSRGALSSAAVVLAGACALAMATRAKGLADGRSGLALGASAGISVVLAGASLAAGPLLDRYFATLEGPVGRFSAWRAALGIVRDYPLFGSGAGSFRYVFPRYQTGETPTGFWKYAHNDLLNSWADLGVVGVALVLAAVIAWYWFAMRPRGKRRVVALACVGAVTAALLHSLVDYGLKQPANALVFSALAGCAIGATGGRRHSLRLGRKTMTSLSVVALALAMVGAPVALAGFRLAGAEAAAGAERVELLRGALALDPSDWEARVALARELGPGSPQDARRALMEEAPEPLLDARVLHMAAMADWSEGLKDRADAQMRLAAETAPGYPDIVHAAGTYFMRRWIEERGGNSPLLDEAVIWLRRTLEVDGRRLRTILEMMALAPASARRMAEVVPEDAAARLWLADRLTEKGRLPEAALLLERTVSSADGRSLFRLHEKLAELRDTMGDVNGALDARVRAVASRPAIERPAAAARIVEKLTSERKWADAMMFAQALGRRMPEGGAAIFASAVLDAASGDHRRAVEGFRRFARTSRLPDAYYRLALSARRLGYLGEAESALNTAVRERPHENRYLLVRAEIREQAGAWNSAAEDIRQALDRSPANVALRRRLADVYSRAGRELMAARVWEEGLAVRPDDPEILTALAASYARAGFFDKAGQFAGKALEIDPESRAAARILESLP